MGKGGGAGAPVEEGGSGGETAPGGPYPSSWKHPNPSHLGHFLRGEEGTHTREADLSFNWGVKQITQENCSVMDEFPIPLPPSLYWATGALASGQ